MKTAFVDLDGTLIDSTLRHKVVLQEALKASSAEVVSVENFVTYKADGYTTLQYLENVLQLEEDCARAVSGYWVEHIEDEKYLELDIWYEDSEIFLHYLSERGYDNIIITARKNKQYITDFINSSPVITKLDEIIVVSPMNAKTEKTRVLNERKTSDSILVGDTEVEYHAGTETGIKTYLLNRGFRSKEYWNRRNVKSYQNLMEIREEINKGR